MAIPAWIKKHRQPKTEIKKIGDNYYLYEVSSIWDSQLKRPKKISGKLLGKITKDGFEPKVVRLRIDENSKLSVKRSMALGLAHK